MSTYTGPPVTRGGGSASAPLDVVAAEPATRLAALAELSARDAQKVGPGAKVLRSYVTVTVTTHVELEAP